MIDDLHIGKSGEVTYADGTPVWRPAPGSRFEQWNEATGEWVEITYAEALVLGAAGQSYRYVVHVAFPQPKPKPWGT